MKKLHLTSSLSKGYIYSFYLFFVILSFHHIIYIIVLIIYHYKVRVFLNKKTLFLIYFLMFITIIRIDLPKDESINIKGVIIYKEESTYNYLYVILKNNKKYEFYYNDDLEIGDYINIEGTLRTYDRNVYYGGYDHYLSKYSKGLYGNIKVFNIYKEKETILKFYFYYERHKTDDKILTYLNKIFFNSQIDSETYNSFNNNYLLFLLSLSGIHFYFIYLIIDYFLIRRVNYLYENRKIIYAIYKILIGIFFIFSLIGIRYLIEGVISFFIYFYNYDVSSYNIRHYSYFFMIILFPYLIFSYSLLIIFIIHNILFLFRSLYNKNNYYIKTLKIQLLLFIFLFPFFKNIPFNIVLIPLFMIIFMPFIFFLLIVANYLSFLKVYVVKILEIYEKLLNIGSNYEISLHKFFAFQTIIYILVVWLSFICNSTRRKIIYIFIVLLVIFIPSLTFNYFNHKVYFLNVGQGDSSVYLSKDLVVVVDAYYGIYNFLEDKGVKKIDYLIITHNHEDHVGEANKLLEKFKINNLVLNSFDNYDIIHDNIIYINNYLVIEKGNVVLSFLGPFKNFNNSNNNSVVLKMQIGLTNILFTGDIEKEAEYLYIDKYQQLLKSNIVKVPHHGSKTSSTSNFIEVVKPEYAIISYHKNNNYQMPSDEVINRYKNSKAKVIETAKNYQIEFSFDKDGRYKITNRSSLSLYQYLI